MRQAVSILRATALEVLSEPLSLLLLLAALALTVLAPWGHLHQFGEPTRMARDAGFSALFLFGSAFAVFCTIRSFRREIESGTLSMALSHPVSRTAFFLAKTAGVAVSLLAFAATVLFTMLVIVAGAAAGAAVAKRTGDIAGLWGPCLAAGVGVILLPLAVAAALNRFGRVRFVLSSALLALALSAAAGAFAFILLRGGLLRYVPVAGLLLLQILVLLAASAAFAVRLPAGGAAAAAGAFFACFLPAVGNYYLPESLSGGASVSWGYVAWAALAALPLLVLFLGLGVTFINRRSFS